MALTPRIKRRSHLRRATGCTFDLLIMSMIIGNIITMASRVRRLPSRVTNSGLAVVNYFFTGVFIFEAAAKIIGLGPKKYWLNPWNKFDAFVVLASFVDILMDALRQQPLLPSCV